VLGAPSAIGLAPHGDGRVRRVDLTPGLLREHGLIERLGARDLGDVLPPARYADVTKPPGRGRNESDVAAYSTDIASRIEAAAADAFVVLVGGDCSIMLGALLGLRKARPGPIGVAYIDAHADFATLGESPSGSACSMNLALATGRSATPLARLRGDGPLVDPADVVQIGARDAGQPYGFDSLEAWGVTTFPTTAIHAASPEAIADRASTRLELAEGGYWIHVDVDVLDPELMPAVDSPEPGGLTIEQLEALLRPLVHHPSARGLQLTLYDPSLDDGAAAPKLVDLLAAVVEPK